jgi:hypothetical protein
MLLPLPLLLLLQLQFAVDRIGSVTEPVSARGSQPRDPTGIFFS